MPQGFPMPENSCLLGGGILPNLWDCSPNQQMDALSSSWGGRPLQTCKWTRVSQTDSGFPCY